MTIVSPEVKAAPLVAGEEITAAPLLRLENVEKTYGEGNARTWVLRRVALAVRAGEFVSVMGPSGAGKSTLLHVLGMHEGGWTGGYWFDGRAVHAMKA